MSKDILTKYAKMVNIAEDLDDKQLSDIGHKVLTGYEDDLASCQEWMNDAKKVTEIASLKTSKKSHPLPESANIKFPVITKAALEFQSRTYPEVVKDGKVVKCRVLGSDLDGMKMKQAERVADYMNYQLMFESDQWEQELDKCLFMLALIGFLCKKTYYDPVTEKTKSVMCDFNDLVIHSKVHCLADAPRISHVLHLKMNDLIEHARAGVFLEEPVKELINQYAEQDDMIHCVVEQHTFLDLDEDDYKEPYIVFFLKDSGKVLSIKPRYTKESIVIKKDKVAKITPDHYFTDYHFLPNPKGCFQSVGFGMLMLHMNETINTLLNQLTDAGSLANMQTGIMSASAKILDGGMNELVPGQFLRVKSDKPLNEAFEMVQYKEPSSVLFQLLGLMIEASRDLSSSTEVMSGSSSPENVKSGAYLGMVEQGMKVHVAILKRIYRSLSQEYRKIFTLNKLYLDPEVYVNVLDDELAVKQEDFDEKTVNVMPVADPNLSSDITRMAQAQFLGSLMGAPGVKPEEIVKYLIESAKIPQPERFIVSEEEKAQAAQIPNPEILKLQADIEKSAQEMNIKGKELEIREKELALNAYKVECEIAKMKTEAILNIAKAEAAEAGTQLQDYQLQLQAIETKIKMMVDERKQNDDLVTRMMEREQEARANETNQPADSGMAPPPADEGVPPSPPEA